MGHVWMTDCDSLYEHWMSQRLNAIENKRLAIDLMALRQQIWERDGERTLVVDHSCGDYPRWIDTPAEDPYWTGLSAAARLPEIAARKLPMLFIGGWYDTFLEPTIEGFRAVADAGQLGIGAEKAAVVQEV